THLERPADALAEMYRVTRPGGRIVVADQDAETRILDLPDHALTRKILNYFCDSLPNGRIGRALPRLFRPAGLTDLSVAAETAVITDFTQGLGSVGFEEAARRARAAARITPAEMETWPA